MDGEPDSGAIAGARRNLGNGGKEEELRNIARGKKRRSRAGIVILCFQPHAAEWIREKMK